MDSLSFAGIPVVSLPGKNGGFTLMENYQISHFTFTETEKLSLLAGLKMQEELLQVPHLGDLIQKVALLTTEKAADSSPISLASATQHRPEIDAFVKERLEQILRALTEEKELMIDYISGTAETSKRKIQPLEIRFINGSWYLDAYCYLREGERQFKLTRIMELEEVSGVDRFQPKSRETNRQEETAKEQAIFIFDGNQLGKLVDFYVEEELTELPDGRIQVTTLISPSQNYIPFLLTFGKHLQIIQPEWLREQRQVEIKAMLES
jgi:predicted DNA-binding transcriptional regulator YafY